ncbi:hypothetical protein I4U23_012880 [Adineta vaga]|nr:hypothetical protein I4U23_012880 [Adineta vaga]
MSSNMSSAEEYLRRTTDWMTTISLFALLFIGPFGCLCNILIFTSKQLTKSSCAFYFRCTAIFEFCILCFGGISRLASEHFGKNLLNENQIYCKFRSYLITAMGTIATYFILLAAVDRCMITSVHIRYRAFGQIKIAYRMSLGIILIGMIVTIHAYVYFDLRPLCTPQPGVYSIFYSVYITVLASILPDGLILIFTLWTLINAQHVRKRLSTTQLANTRQQRHVQKTEAHLLIMMISQALITVLLDIPRVSCYSYYFLTANTPKITSYYI